MKQNENTNNINNAALESMDRGELVRAAITKARTEKAQGYRVIDNDQFNSKEIYFDGIPGVKTRDSLKALKFRWHGQKKCWYGYATDEQIKEACGDVLVIPETKIVEPGSLYQGWEGGNAHVWHNDQELKKLILDDCKRVGIKASIRFKNAGYLTSFIMTISISSDHIKTYEEYKKEFNIYRHGGIWPGYIDGDGNYKSIHIDQFEAIEDPAEKAELLEKITRHSYDMEVSDLTHSKYYSHDGRLVLTDAGNEIFKTVYDIVSSYNHDQSNGMIDYFDRSIYDSYTFKIVA